MELRPGFEIGRGEPTKKPRRVIDKTPIPPGELERQEITGEEIESAELNLLPGMPKALERIRMELQTSPHNILAARQELFEAARQLPSSKMPDQQLEYELMLEAKKIIKKHQTVH